MTTPFPFTSGQVLTAAQLNAITELVVNDKTASHTLTAADAGDRVIMNSASATTITVDTSIFTAGQVIYVTNKGVGVCTITAGTATVSTTGTLALAQFASGVLYCISAGVFLFEAYGVAAAASGLELISTTTIGTTVASVTVSSAFSATFDNYKITVSSGVGSTNANLNMTLGATVTGYYWAGYNSDYSPASLGSIAASNTSSWQVGRGDTGLLNSSVELFSPNLAKKTRFSAIYANTNTNGHGSANGGFVDNTTQYTALTITPSSGTITGGTIRVYGYKN